jgi:phosphonate degradation associated HDIG domain protein
MHLTIDRILSLFETRGVEQYGEEAVSQAEHARQCAAQAERANATAELITAAMLHDLGHLLHGLGEYHLEDGVDDEHQYIALPFLRDLFSAAVLQPIRLHVDAKRYLCAVEPAYWGSLSPASQRSLELQGGVYTPAQAEAFIVQPHAQDAVQLRRWDDLAKVNGLETPALAHFASYLRACSRVAEPTA